MVVDLGFLMKVGVACIQQHFSGKTKQKQAMMLIFAVQPHDI